MATMTEPIEATEQQRSHEYHAEAHVLSGELHRPIRHTIEQHAPIVLKDERGGHLKRVAHDASVEGLISFKTGYSRVSGSKSLKHHGWVTLSTSIMEGLNVFEVITADRVVAQVATEHPYEQGHVPHVTFLGTKFENLRVGGFPVQFDLDLGICGKRPDGDKSYLTNCRFLNGIRGQVASIANAEFLPQTVRDEYDMRLTQIDDLVKRSTASNDASHRPGKVTCSLVKSIDIKDIPIPGLKTVGNVLFIPDFGTVALAEVEVGVALAKPSNAFERQTLQATGAPAETANGRPLSNYFNLKMIDMTLGCVGHGKVIANMVMANGNTKP